MNVSPKTNGGTSHMPPPASAPVTVNTASVDVRLAFIRKVYILLFINFAITIGISCAFTFVDSVRSFIVQRTYLVWISIAVAIVALLVIACLPLKYPLDVLFMYVFVLAYSTMIGVIVARYYDAGWGGIVLQAFIATAAVFFSITAFVFITKIDFSFLRYFLFAGLVVLIVLSLFSFLISFPRNGRSRWFMFGISVLGYVHARARACAPPPHHLPETTTVQSVLTTFPRLSVLLLLLRDRLRSSLLQNPRCDFLYTEYVIHVLANCEHAFAASDGLMRFADCKFVVPPQCDCVLCFFFLPTRHRKALLMTGYLLYDTSLVLKRYGPDQWLIAVVSLYIDVSNLFLYLLNIFSFANS